MTARVVSRSPYDGRVVSDVVATSPRQLEAALDRAHGGVCADPDERGQLLRRFADRIDAGAAALAGLIVAETGKRIGEAEAEVEWTARTARWYADHPPADAVVGGVYVRAVPLGVVAVITPWNAPAITPAWKLCPALMAGNSVIWKPSELASGTALTLAAMLADAGAGAGVLELLCGGAELGAALVADARVDGVHFTGSTAVGRQIAATAGRRLARFALELGGSNPAIVLDDADLEAAADAIVASMAAINGQKCTATRRVIVHARAAAALTELLRARVALLVPGDPAERATPIGPLISPQAVAVARRAIAGAQIIAAAPAGSGAAAFSPCVVRGALPADELFAPVLALESVTDDAAAIVRANSTPYGLAGAVHTRDRERARRVAERLEAGVVTVNRRTDAVELEPPFSGHKASGNGVPEGGYYAYAGVTEHQALYGLVA